MEITDIMQMAETVNKMSYGMARIRIKKLEQVHEISGLNFKHTIELQFILTKILSSKQ